MYSWHICITSHHLYYFLCIAYDNTKICSSCHIAGSWHSWYPVKHTEIKVVSIENSEVLADGSKGVVKVRGPQVMKGYYKDHFFQFTDAKF